MKPLVVVGDAVLDIDVEGATERLCPDAPVPVVDVGTHWRRPGGAGLAAMFAARTTADVVLVTALGTDPAGTTLTALLEREVKVLPLPLRGETSSKLRVRAGGKTLLRLDSGTGTAAPARLDPAVTAALRSAGTILVADYGRGVTGHPELRRLLTELAPGTPVVWDPHPKGSAPVPGALLVTPNLAEARLFAPGHRNPAVLARRLREQWAAGGVTVTTGRDGAVLADGMSTSATPVPRAYRSAAIDADSCGAGDRFAASAASALLAGASPREAVRAAVVAAARYVLAGGPASVSRCDTSRTPGTAFAVAERIRASGGRLVATGGCFDLLHPGHTDLLRRARALGDALVVCLNSDESVRRLKGPARPIIPARDRARLLLELSSVDAVVTFDEPTPVEVLARLRPDVWVKGADYHGTELPEREVVGEIVLIPLLEGYSTTRLIDLLGARGDRGPEDHQHDLPLVV
ncbi:rfaE bifunctional protein, domain I/rfaE bifunctional protein, domain II [Amycolatopsis xylanica]|uniref:RfaE bifunctional protein, domain I/rfaE bifunctional protein, domain II n=1 Tax=Amycolatopsis xylanica TaxID=589385 RepID=A0A1H2TFJ6_9PSEU|nr:PfkB family carbohydrate kinase [Amycolatopsis xylanica]SDW42044.1 rfaE bifunctional protein, domain I/rfaE bifunctional protein, domain II [Amycolatopsis xylanica]